MDVAALGDQGQQTQQGSQQGAQEGQQGASEKPSRPEWLPESYFDAEKAEIKFDDFGKHYAELATGAKAEQDRLAAYPQKIEELKFELPADLKLPEGMKLDESNPTFQAFKQFAFENKMDPALGSKIVSMHVQEQVRQADAINKRVGEELGKLGANGSARITALRTALDAHVGPALSKSVMAGVFTAGQVDGMEKLLLVVSNGNTRSAPANGRETDTDQKPETVEQKWYGATNGAQKG